MAPHFKLLNSPLNRGLLRIFILLSDFFAHQYGDEKTICAIFGRGKLQIRFGCWAWAFDNIFPNVSNR